MSARGFFVLGDISAIARVTSGFSTDVIREARQSFFKVGL
jgi:hypothetical protein